MVWQCIADAELTIQDLVLAGTDAWGWSTDRAGQNTLCTVFEIQNT